MTDFREVGEEAFGGRPHPLLAPKFKPILNRVKTKNIISLVLKYSYQIRGFLKSFYNF